MDARNSIFIFERDSDPNCQLLMQANILVLHRLAQGYQLPQMLVEVMRTMIILPAMTPIWSWYATLGFVILSQLGTRPRVWQD